MNAPLQVIQDTPDLTGMDLDATLTSKIVIAKKGQFTDPRYGKFAITDKDFQDWVRNFSALNPNVAGDLDHASERGGSTEAAGWIKSLQPEGDHLMAEVEWTPVGAKAIQEKRYRFISPSYGTYVDEKGKKTPNVLKSFALTNKPFLREGMPALSLSQAIEDEREALTALRVLADSTAAPTPQSPSDSRRRMSEFTNIAKSLNLAEDADEATILSAIEDLSSREVEQKSLSQLASDEGKVVLDASDYEAVKSDASKGRQALEELADERFARVYDKALSEGKIKTTDEARDEWRKRFDRDAEDTTKLLSELPAQVNTGAPHGATGTGAGDAPEGVDQDSYELNQRVEAYAREHNVDYAKALDAVLEVSL